jgi:hypothetical protein
MTEQNADALDRDPSKKHLDGKRMAETVGKHLFLAVPYPRLIEYLAEQDSKFTDDGSFFRPDGIPKELVGMVVEQNAEPL